VIFQLQLAKHPGKRNASITLNADGWVGFEVAVIVGERQA
jgi:hypothetical protein